MMKTKMKDACCMSMTAIERKYLMPTCTIWHDWCWMIWYIGLQFQHMFYIHFLSSMMPVCPPQSAYSLAERHSVLSKLLDSLRPPCQCLGWHFFPCIRKRIVCLLWIDLHAQQSKRMRFMVFSSYVALAQTLPLNCHFSHAFFRLPLESRQFGCFPSHVFALEFRNAMAIYHDDYAAESRLRPITAMPWRNNDNY